VAAASSALHRVLEQHKNMTPVVAREVQALAARSAAAVARLTVESAAALRQRKSQHKHGGKKRGL